MLEALQRRAHQFTAARLKLPQLRLSDRHGHALIHQVRANGWTFLSYGALYDLYARVRAVEERNLPGVLVEAGTARGGSAIVMAYAKAASRPLEVYDAFGMIPPPSDRDGQDAHDRYREIVEGRAKGVGQADYYGYDADLLAAVQANFQQAGIDLAAAHVGLVKGLYAETLRIDAPVALAHLDCDWYDSVITCLTQIVPNLVPGGWLVVDDYFDWSGCRRAVDDYFAGKRQDFNFVIRSRLHIQRRG